MNGNGWQRLSIIAAVVVQIIVVAGFIIRLGEQTKHNADQIDDLRKAFDRHETRLDNINDRIGSNTARLDQFGRDLQRMDERSDKIVQALDSLYSQFTDHLRNHPK